MCLRGWVLRTAIVVYLSPLSFAQTSDWAVVKQLSGDQRVKIETADGKSHVGHVQSANDEAIWIGKDQQIQSQDVQHVSLWSPGHHGRNALIGLGIGAGLGLAAGASCGGKGAIVSRGECMAVGVPVFGGIGAAVGALLPSRGRWHELYRRK